MRISYIPAAYSNVQELPGTEAARDYLQNAIAGAITDAIVKPFQSFCYNTWCGLVKISLPACVIASLTALILRMIGVKKAEQWVFIPILVYIILKLADVMLTGGGH